MRSSGKGGRGWRREKPAGRCRSFFGGRLRVRNADIWEFSAADNVDRADEFVDRLDAKYQSLITHPMMGRERSELAAGLRSLPMPPYVIFYRPIGDGIEIVRVLHGARDVRVEFGGES